jgi:hypothetical protein
MTFDLPCAMIFFVILSATEPMACFSIFSASGSIDNGKEVSSVNVGTSAHGTTSPKDLRQKTGG